MWLLASGGKRIVWLVGVVASMTLAMAATATADVLYASTFLGGEIWRFDLPLAAGSPIVNGLSFPEDGACSPVTGQIFFAESNDGRITRFDADGLNPTDIIPAAGRVAGPEGLTFDSDGNLYFNTREIGLVTEGAWRIDDGDPVNPADQIVAPFTAFGEGSEIIVAGPHAGALLLVARAEREVYISEPPGDPIQLFIDSAAFPADTNLYGVVSNGCGEVFVAFAPSFLAFAPSEVYRFDAEGTFIDVYADDFVKASFMEFDSSGNLYVADSDDDTVWKIEPDKSKSIFFNLPGSPTGLAICRDLPAPACGLTCDAGGPYSAECAGTETCLEVDGSSSSQAGGGAVDAFWTSDCPGARFADDTALVTELCVDTTDLGCSLACEVTIEVSNGVDSESCTAPVTIQDSLPPLVSDCILEPLDPRPPMSAGSAVSSAGSELFAVVCGFGADACDPDPAIDATVILTRHVPVPGGCDIETELVPAACGEVFEIVELASPCGPGPPRSPRSPRPPVSVRSDGTRVLAAEEIRLEVVVTDACGGSSACVAE